MSIEKLDSIAVRVTKEIRHMDRIDHDPEGQRILKLVSAALREAYNLSVDEGKTTHTHITTAKDIQFKVEGVTDVKDAKIVQEAMPAHSILACTICSKVHDPRQQYDHAAVEPLRRTG